MRYFGHDLRYAWRSLRNSPGFLLITVLTLALAIGANTAIFAVVDSVLLRPLPFPEPDRIVSVRHFNRETGVGNWRPSFLDYVDYRDQNRSFEELSAWRPLLPSVSASFLESPVRVLGAGVTPNFFSLLRVEPLQGRLFSPEDGVIGAGRVAIVSATFHQRYFGPDAAVVGTSIRVADDTYTIVGVLPTLFGGKSSDVFPGAETEVWLPYLNSPAAEGRNYRGLANVNVIGRLRSGVTEESTKSDLSAIAARIEQENPELKENTDVRLMRLHEALVGNSRSTLVFLFSSVTLLLLISCVNIFNLVLSRLRSRRRDLAVRAALGASTPRLASVTLSEAAILGALGTGLGSLFSYVGLDLLLGLAPDRMPGAATAQFESRAVVFMVLISVGVTLLLGILPWVANPIGRLQRCLRESTHSSSAGRKYSRLRSSLVVVEVSAAVILVLGAGLLGRSLARTLAEDPGFRPNGVLLARVQLPGPFISTEWQKSVAFFGELTKRVREIGTVESAAAAYNHPMSEGWSNRFRFEDRPAGRLGDQPDANFRPVTPGYFRTAGIPLLSGRVFNDSDDSNSPRVVVVNQAFVRQFFPDGTNPLGKRLVYGDFWDAGPPEYEIVGVVGDVRFAGQATEPVPATYFAHAHQPVREMTLLIRTQSDPLSLVDDVRAVVKELDPLLPLDDISTLETALADSAGQARFLTYLLAVFSGIALVIACVGIYGVLSLSITQRRRELGIRIALGAAPRQLRLSVLGQAAFLAVTGLAFGLAGSLLVNRLLRDLLYGIETTDPVTWAAVGFCILSVALLAGYPPARRSTRVDPVSAVRSE